MNIKERFPSDVSGWVKYSRYQIDESRGQSLICPLPDSQPILYSPLDNALDMLLDALNLGCAPKLDDTASQQVAMDFVQKYGLLGICADLPLNENFFSSDVEVHIPENPFGIPSGTIKLGQYLSHFFPATFLPKSEDTLGNLSRRHGQLYNSLFSKEYGEESKWYKHYFRSLYAYFMACSNFDIEHCTVEIVDRYQVNRLRYTVMASEKPTFQWIFPSLKSVIDMALTLCVTADEMPLKVCKKCGKIYYNENARSEFCSGRCRNQWNVYKSRGKK